MARIDDLLDFIRISPSPYHVVDTVVQRLHALGFTEAPDGDALSDGGLRYRRDGGSLIAWADAGHTPDTGFVIVGAHTDSPNLRIKPRPDLCQAGFRLVGVEVYGGVLLNSWLDRDLGLSGRVAIDVDGRVEQHLVLLDRAVARIPQLAIHLDREVNSGLHLDPQAHLRPVWGLETAAGVASVIADELDIAVDRILGWDLMLHDLTPPALLGVDHRLVSAPRIDDQLSCWAGLVALETVLTSDAPPTGIPVLCLFDHEEVGSSSTTGAGGPALENVLERSVRSRGGDRDAHLGALASSLLLSADGAHAMHPNYPERHEPEHRIQIDGGPVLKINGNQRYATDAFGAAEVTRIARRDGIPLQRFVTRNDMPCGSTIGPIAATRLGIRTVDLGVAQLSMHSARELCGADDPVRFVDLLTGLFRR